MNPFYSGYIHRLRTTLVTGYDASRMSEWIQTNTMDPVDGNRPWSFKGHEFQIDILNDPAQDVSVQKCSQVGLSEIVVRMSVAILMMLRGGHGILTLPAQSFARQFARTRIQPVLDSSKQLRDFCGMRDSTELKRIGNCFLWIRGTKGQASAISVPAEFVINDEVDFSDQDVVSSYSSRLRHSHLKIRRRLSTPTTSRYGINKLFNEGSQGYYMVCCSRCNTWVSPRPFEHVVVPGLEVPFDQFRKEHAEAGNLDYTKAFIQCPSCSRGMRWSDFCNAERRTFVHAYPSRERRSYQVFPWDVPSYNPLAEVLGSVMDYRTAALYFNFVWGLPFEDAENSFLVDVIIANSTLRPHAPDNGSVENCVLGVDIGKVSWLLAGRPNELGGLDVFWRQKLYYSPANPLMDQILAIRKKLNARVTVIDAAPDFSTALGVVGALPEGMAYGGYYAREGSSPDKMTYIDGDEQKGTVAIRRTASFDELAREMNYGKWRWAQFANEEESTEFKDHIQSMRRVEREDGSSGSVRGFWESTRGDHYLHAANYLRTAWQLSLEASPAVYSGAFLAPAKAKLNSPRPAVSIDNRY